MASPAATVCWPALNKREGMIQNRIFFFFSRPKSINLVSIHRREQIWCLRAVSGTPRCSNVFRAHCPPPSMSKLVCASLFRKHRTPTSMTVNTKMLECVSAWAAAIEANLSEMRRTERPSRKCFCPDSLCPAETRNEPRETRLHPLQSPSSIAPMRRMEIVDVAMRVCARAVRTARVEWGTWSYVSFLTPAVRPFFFRSRSACCSCKCVHNSAGAWVFRKCQWRGGRGYWKCGTWVR